MKKLLIVLFVIAMAVPAGATVLIYNMKETCTGIEFWSGQWESYKSNWSAYLLIQQTDTGKAEVRAVWLWKEGKQKCAESEDWGEVDFIPAELANEKEMCVISTSYDEGRLLLTGASKMTKIAAYKEASCGNCHNSSKGDIVQKVPGSLAGYLIEDNKEGDPVTYRDLYTSKMALKLNAKFTLEGHLHGALDIDDAVDELLEFLEEEEGYYIYW